MWSGGQLYKGGNVTVGGPENFLIKTSTMQKLGAAMLQVPMPLLPSGDVYDEQILFLAEELPVKNMLYKLTLGDGTTVEGRTDDEGKTERVVTAQPVAITQADFYRDTPYRCDCHRSLLVAGPCAPWHMKAPVIQCTPKDVKTNKKDIGKSCVRQDIPYELRVRGLTKDEINAAKTVFKDSIDYSKVKLQKGGLAGGPSLLGNLMTPFGMIHTPPGFFSDNYFGENPINKDDGTKVRLIDQCTIIHEIGHVWQYQLGYPVALAAGYILDGGGYGGDYIAYQYDLSGDDLGRPFRDFNIEQQADLISHYFSVTVLKVNFKKFLPEYGDLDHLKVALEPFLRDPTKKNVDNLLKHYDHTKDDFTIYRKEIQDSFLDAYSKDDEPDVTYPLPNE